MSVEQLDIEQGASPVRIGGLVIDRAENEDLAKMFGRVANCEGINTDQFYPELGACELVAKEVCKGCVMRVPCLQFALDNDIRTGISGGFNVTERDRLVKLRSCLDLLFSF